MESISSTAMPVMHDAAHSTHSGRIDGGQVRLEFSEVYRRYFGFAWASLRRLGVPSASIDDAAQDFWVTVHRRLSTVTADASIKAWLFGVARRVASHYRRRDFRNRRKLAALGDASTSRVDRSMHRRDVAMSLEVALDQLDEPKRTAFVLSELEGWSAPEIARAVGSKPNTIYSRIRLAKEQLREHLSDGSEDRNLDELAEETREATLAPPGAGKRCLAAIAPKLALAAPVATTAPVAISTMAQLKLLLAGAGIGAVVVAGAHAMLPAKAESTPAAVAQGEVETAPTSAPRTPESPRVAAPKAPPVAETAVIEPKVAEAPARAATPDKPTTDEPSAVDPLQRETRLLSDAQQALAAGRYEQALAKVAQHTEEHPRGKLRELRAVIEVEALCAAGRADEARRRAQTALAESPAPKVARKLEAACSEAG